MSAASSETPRPQIATSVELLAIPEDVRFHEVLDGELVRKFLPGWRHGGAQTALVGLLFNRFNRAPNGAARPGGWWLRTEVEIELADHQVARPDVAGWRRERVSDEPVGAPIRVPPDWVCEVMTDGQARRRDGIQKRRIYADHEVPHYWLVDTERETLTVLQRSSRGYEELLTAGRSDVVRAEPFASLELRIGVLFGDDPE